jgi:hypothetical protein
VEEDKVKLNKINEKIRRSKGMKKKKKKNKEIYEKNLKENEG